MSLKTSLIVVFVSLAVLLSASLVLFLSVLENEKKLHEAESKRYRFSGLLNDFKQSSHNLSSLAQSVVKQRNLWHREYFQKVWDIRRGTAPRPEHYQHINWDKAFFSQRFPEFFREPQSLMSMMEKVGFTKKELSLLREARVYADRLASWEKRAIHLAVGLFPDKKGGYTVKGKPDQQRAVEMLFQKEYYALKSKMAEPISEVFQISNQRFMEETEGVRSKKGYLVLGLVMSIGLSVVLIVVSCFLVVIYFRRGKEDDVGDMSLFAYVKNSFWGNWPIVMSSVVVAFMIVCMSWWFFKETERQIRKELRANLESNIKGTFGAVTDWIYRTGSEAHFLADMIERDVSEKLFQEIERGEYLRFHQELRDSGIVGTAFFKDYVVVNSKGIVASSSYSNIIGRPLSFPVGTISKLKNPEGRMIFFPRKEKDRHPLLVKNIVWGVLFKNDRGAVYFIIPPEKGLQKIFDRGAIGASGNIYMVNNLGQFITESRWKDKIGKVDNETGIRTVRGMRVAKRLEDVNAPLTYGVRELLLGRNNGELKKYNNYLGRTVLGLWRWNQSYGFGIVLEIDRSEAFALFNNYGHYVLLGGAFTICLLLTLIFFFIRSKMKVAYVSMELSDTYSTIKKQNEKFETEMNIGHRVQMDMLPDRIEGKGFVLGAYLTPAQSLSGDFYDFSFVTPEKDKVYFCVGDVSGKGVAASLFMSMSKVALRKTLNQNHEMDELVGRVNKELSANNESCMFVTLIVGVMDVKTGKIMFTNAGHNQPYLKRHTGEVLCLEKVDGPLVGTFEGATFTKQEIQLSVGDTLLLYTDGVTEAQNLKQEFYEEIRLERFLKRGYFSSPQHLVDSISEDVTVFIGEADQFDDITILALEYTGNYSAPA